MKIRIKSFQLGKRVSLAAGLEVMCVALWKKIYSFLGPDTFVGG